MSQVLRISERYRLASDEGEFSVLSADGSKLLSLPAACFIQASFNTYSLPRQNNHYHKLSQSTQVLYRDPVIGSLTEGPAGAALEGTLGSGGERIRFVLEFGEDGNGFSLRVAVEHPRVNRVRLRFRSPAGERFFGFGEQFTYLDFTGMRFPLIVGEQGLGRGAEPCSSLVEAKSGSAGDAFTTYAPIAVAVTSDRRAFFVESDRIMTMDVKASDPALVEIEVWGPSFELRAWRGESLLDAVSLHTAYTGRYRPLPLWAHGVVLGLRGGKETAERVLERCAHSRVPVTALWIEDWVGRRGKNYGPPLWWRWRPDEGKYPDFRNWARSLSARGIKVLTYFNPFIADDEDYAEYREAMDRGFFVRDANGRPYRKRTGTGYGYYMVDLSKREAYGWFKRLMLSAIREYGISGWMADYGEYLSLDCLVSEGVSGEEYHQRYALDWVRLNREVVEEAGLLGDALVFNRCGWGRVNSHSLSFWEGDQNVAWDEHDGLASSIVGLVSGGLSGIAINHADIGGHTTVVSPFLRLTRSKELFWRWCELAAFTPVYRTHDGTLTEPNHQFYSSCDTTEFFGLMGRLHGRLADYFLHLEREAADKGYPLIRHTMLHDEPAALLDLRYQFLLGADLVLFPVRQPGAEEVSGYVPAGEWLDPWSGAEIAGGRHASFPARLGKPACLARKGSAWGEKIYNALREFVIEEAPAYAGLELVHPADLGGEKP